MTEDIFSGTAASPDMRTERAQRAVRAFRAMQPGLSGYARAVTGRKDVSVELATGVPRTDGKKIFFRPPIALGDMTPHQRMNCDRRDPETRLQLCLACRNRETVLISIYHEIAHIVYGTFAPPSEKDKIEAVQRAVAEVPGKYAARVQQAIEAAPYYKKNDYLNLSSLISPFLPVLVNAIEDARVDEAMFKARKGTRVMFGAFAQSVFVNGIEEDDGSVTHWTDKPLNSQALVGVFVLAAGYKYKDWFAPEVEEALGDARLRELISRIDTLRSAEGSYALAFPILARLRELGFCKLPEEEDDSEENPEENEENNEQEQQEDGEPDEGEGSDPDGSGGSGSGESSGDDDAVAGDAPEDSGDEGDSGERGTPDEGEGQDRGDEGEGSDEEGDEAVGDEPGAGEPDLGEDAGDHGELGAGSDDSAEDSDGADPDDEEVRGDESFGSGDGPREPSDSDADSEESPGDGGARSDGMAPEGDESSDEAADEPGGLTDGEDSDRDGEDREEDGSGDPVDSSDGDEEDLDDVEVIDTGADEGMGGTETDQEIDYGDADQALKDVQVFGQHEAMFDHGTSGADKADEDAIDKAIIQGQYFENPSQRVGGVREHKYGVPYIDDEGHDRSDAWGIDDYWKEYTRQELRRLGMDDELIIGEDVLGPALNEMRRAFSDNQRAKHERHLTSGKINARVLGKRAWAKDERLFQKKRLPGKRSYAVILGIDISGSTVGVNLALAKRAAKAQAELCHRMGIDFAVYAHTANPTSVYGSFGSELWLDMYEIKSFDQPWNDHTQQALKDISANSENLDGHGVEYYRKTIERHPATDKIILYYTDGKMPAANHDEELEILQREIRYCQQHKITLLGVGIRTDSPRRHGLDTVEVNDDSDTPKVVRHLQSALLHNR